MRKLDKTCKLSTVYKNWEENLEKDNTKHPEYNSTKGEFYTDIFTNLLNIQNKLSKEKWKNGKFHEKIKKVKSICSDGALDHFNPDLKENKAWLWDNFFFISTESNNHKGQKTVDNILKPDTNEYDEFELLEYVSKEHIFIANTDLDIEIQNRVNKMIDTLGINLVQYQRKQDLQPKVEDITIGKIKTWKNTNIYQFPTAFKMIKKKLKTKN